MGVHQDGLVHLSQIAHRFVKNPADALNVGQAVKVKVLAVDLERKRIALSIKALLAAPEGADRPQPHHRRPQSRPDGNQPRPQGGPRPPRSQSGPQAGARPQGPRPPRTEGPRPPRAEGPRPPRSEGLRPPRPEQHPN